MCAHLRFPRELHRCHSSVTGREGIDPRSSRTRADRRVRRDTLEMIALTWPPAALLTHEWRTDRGARSVRQVVPRRSCVSPRRRCVDGDLVGHRRARRTCSVGAVAGGERGRAGPGAALAAVAARGWGLTGGAAGRTCPGRRLTPSRSRGPGRGRPPGCWCGPAGRPPAAGRRPSCAGRHGRLARPRGRRRPGRTGRWCSWPAASAGAVVAGVAWSVVLAPVRAASSVPGEPAAAPKPLVSSTAPTIAMTPAPTPAGIHRRPADRVTTVRCASGAAAGVPSSAGSTARCRPVSVRAGCGPES